MPLFTVPDTRSMMVRHINVGVSDLLPGTTNHYVNVTTGTCGQSPASYLANVRITGEGLVSIPIGDGIGLPRGTQINGFLHDADGLIDLYGYTMTKGAVPAVPAALRRSGPAHVAGSGPK